LGAVLNKSYFSELDDKIKTQRSGELFVKSVLMLYFYMVTIQ